MKKFFLSLLISVAILPLFAEGYQVNVLSTKQTGMGHVGTGMKLGAENMHFNPAGLVFMKNTFDFSVGISAVSPRAKYISGDYSEETDNPVSTPIYAYAGFKIYDNFAAGIAFTTPYGSTLKWPKNWKGSNLIQDIALKSYVIQPTFSYKITDKLSIGAGLDLAIGKVTLSRALFSPSEFQLLKAVVSQVDPTKLPDVAKQEIIKTISEIDGAVPVSATLDGKANIRAGFNVGIMYDVCDKVTLGLSYRSRIKMKVKEGDAQLDYASLKIEKLFAQLGELNPKLQVPPMNEGTFKAELPLPSNTTLGVSYRPTKRWEVALDLQYVGWSAYDSLNVQFTPNVLNGYTIKAEKNYKNTIIARIGAQYEMTERLDLRAGIYYDQSPIRSNNYNPETPGMNKLGMSAGFTFEPVNHLQIDFAFLYIQGFSQDGSYNLKNVITQQNEVFSGKYESNAITASLGLAYRF
ncbi:MAG: outer membrane protein transport protein [Odoribacter sp.]